MSNKSLAVGCILLLVFLMLLGVTSGTKVDRAVDETEHVQANASVTGQTEGKEKTPDVHASISVTKNGKDEVYVIDPQFFRINTEHSIDFEVKNEGKNAIDVTYNVMPKNGGVGHGEILPLESGKTLSRSVPAGMSVLIEIGAPFPTLKSHEH